MALLGNYSVFNRGPGRYCGGGSTTALAQTASRANFNRSGASRNFAFQDGTAAAVKLAAQPSGCYPPVAWMMPITAGSLAARSTVIGEGSFAATGQSGYNIAADISGAGTIPGCDIGLIVSIAATLTASGGISSAAVDALASMVATLTGSGDITATAAGLADLGATLTGAGVVVAGNTALMDIEATIRGYGDLTPEGLRDAVWNAILANYPDVGTAGNTLANAGAGGNPWSAIIEDGMTAEEVLRVIASVLAGKVSGAGTGTETFVGLDGTTNRVVSTVDVDGNRSNVVVDGT